jgi:hypothetical protein
LWSAAGSRAASSARRWFFALSFAGVTALELGVPMGDARAAMN